MERDYGYEIWMSKFPSISIQNEFPFRLFSFLKKQIQWWKFVFSAKSNTGRESRRPRWAYRINFVLLFRIISLFVSLFIHGFPPYVRNFMAVILFAEIIISSHDKMQDVLLWKRDFQLQNDIVDVGSRKTFSPLR